MYVPEDKEVKLRYKLFPLHVTRYFGSALSASISRVGPTLNLRSRFMAFFSPSCALVGRIEEFELDAINSLCEFNVEGEFLLLTKII